MTLGEKIHNDLIAAQKGAKLLEVSVLRMLQSALHNRQIEKRARLIKTKALDPLKLNDEQLDELSKLEERETMEVVRAEVKKRKEAIELYQKGERPELAKKESAELELLQRYLPASISDNELEKMAVGVIGEIGAKGKQDFGKVMKELMSKTQGRAEGVAMSKIVQKLLS